VKRIGVIGYPLGHSISPIILQVALDACGIGARYEAWETPPQELAERVRALRSGDVLGANVTIPHKEAVIGFLDGTEGLAVKSGAVNTIVNDEGRLTGHNTDAVGFTRALREDGGFDPRGRRAVVLGAGGAGRAVVLVLVEAGAGTVFAMDVVPERARALVSSLGEWASERTDLSWGGPTDEAFRQALSGCQLLVNCTPVGTRGGQAEGLSPVSGDEVPRDVLVFDLVYNPLETPLVAAARARGNRAISGLKMLIYQAAESFRLWTGCEAPVERMLEAGRKALGAAKGLAASC
jgi:shikimate dehydrogenase